MKPFCRICENEFFEEKLYFPKSPRNIERLLSREFLAQDTPVGLKVFQCKTCGHVQLLNQLQDDYYEEYLMTHSHVKKMLNFQKNQAQHFVDFFSLGGKRIFEAGSGDGQFSLILKELGCQVISNEPSAVARKACREKGLETIDGYVSAGSLSDLNGTFDAVIARQVLEHVPLPNDFMQGVKNLLKPDGVCLIEVPSLEQSIEQYRFFDFFPDHLSYFSSGSLTHLFSRNCFELVRLNRVMDGEYNEIWGRNKKNPDLMPLQEAADRISLSFKTFLDHETKSGRRVAIWGAGAKGVLTLSMVDVNPVAYLIDLDPVKEGRFIPVSHLQVSNPRRLLSEPVDTVIITAMAYKDEIISDLKNQYSFKGKIAFLSGGEIITLSE
jgi:SAM-dependent methyltransferase